MKFNLVSIFPKIIEAHFQEGLIAQAIKKSLIELRFYNPREQTQDLHKTVDDRPFGGGDGMTMLIEPLSKTVQKIKKENPASYFVFMSPQGKTLNQAKVLDLAQKKNLTIICGRYAGVDQRFINAYVDEEISIGDYVLSGGEIAACVLIDSMGRQLPGVLGDKASCEIDSFSEKIKGLLEAPQFTRPQSFHSAKVPDILLSGHHANIQKWREKVSVLVTLQKRKDLLANFVMSDKEKQDLRLFFKNLSDADRQVLGLKIGESDLADFLGE